MFASRTSFCAWRSAISYSKDSFRRASFVRALLVLEKTFANLIFCLLSSGYFASRAFSLFVLASAAFTSRSSSSSSLILASSSFFSTIFLSIVSICSLASSLISLMIALLALSFCSRFASASFSAWLACS